MVALLLFIGTGSASAAVTPLNAKSGIDIAFPGAAAGRDYVVEQLYSDPLYDDRGVVYIKSATPISLAHNADNIDPNGYVIGEKGNGVIRYKIDGDELWEGESGRGNAQAYSGDNSPTANATFFQYSGPFNLSSVAGRVGDNGLAETAWGHYHKGVRDAFGDEWHTLTYWDDDSGWFSGLVDGWDLYLNTSDGKMVQFVVNPKTPAISFSASGTGRYYTTPPKTYYIPKIHAQKTYLTRGVTIRLVNLTNDKPVYFSFDKRRWRRYPRQPKTLPALLKIARRRLKSGKIYILYYRNGGRGPVKYRRLYFNPPSPTKGKEFHPKLWWRSAAERAVLKRRLSRSPYKAVYSSLKNSPTYTKSNLNFHSGNRYWGVSRAGGFGSHKELGHAAVNNGFVAAIEGYGYANYTYANRAKAALLAGFTIDPIGDENPNTAAYSAPSQDRTYFGFARRNHIAFPAGYDLMADYTTANGYSRGFTPIEEYKVRDNLASEALQLLHRHDSERARANWIVGNDLALPAFAMAMPTYNTPYYGTSGADVRPAGYRKKTRAAYFNAPFPRQKVTWWEASVNPNVRTPGYPNLTNKWGLFTYFAGDGLWKEGHLGQYNRHLFPYIAALMNFRANFDGGRYLRLEEHAAGLIYNRHPKDGKSLASANGESERNDGMLSLINNRFPDARLYRWHLDTPAAAAVNYRDDLYNHYNLAYNLAFFDDSIRPRPAKSVRITPNTATFNSNPKDPKAIFGRLQGQDFSDIRIRWPGQATDFMIDAYGENLLVRPGTGWTNGVPLSPMAVSPKGYNTILIDDTTPAFETGVTPGSRAPLTGLTGPRLSFAAQLLDGRRDGGPYGAKKIRLERTVLFVDRRFFILFDELRSRTGRHRYGLTLHGSSDGHARRLTLDQRRAVAVWQKAGGVKLLAKFIAPKLKIARYTAASSITGKNEPYIIATAKGTNTRFITALIPLRPGASPPLMRRLKGPIAAGKIKTERRTFLFSSASNHRLRPRPGGYETDAEIAVVAYNAKNKLDYFMIRRGRRFKWRGRVYLNAPKQVDAIFDAGRTYLGKARRASR